LTGTLYYFYDDSGSIIGFEYNGTTYYYGKNLQGDIVCIYDTNGNRVVYYKYDAWGNILSITGSLASTIGEINPFRYRSYYYDVESGFYYLNSRYYDPSVGRFLNADSIIGANGGIQGYNMFAYCANNPINFIDSMGTCPHDFEFYTSGNFEGQHKYNPDCRKCKNHGDYTLTGKDGIEYTFYNSSYELELMGIV